MNRLASHRGPDGEGYWTWDGQSKTGQFVENRLVDQADSRGVFALGHCRLAILHLSEAGRQPMASKDRSVWIAFNGEIYNYLELRHELIQLGHTFTTGTDTEVILAAYGQWGTECFARFNGMWGLAIVDLRRPVVVLSRDRLGVKPLYIWAKHGALAFASEIKQFFVLPGVEAVVNMDAVSEYIDTGYEAPPATFFKDILAFPAGSWSQIPIEQPHHSAAQPFWFPEHLEATKVSQEEAIERTRSLFEDTVTLRLRSDVPVGVCLSGGLDSSSIFGQVQRLKNGQAKSTYAFSAAFHEAGFDERPYVKTVLDQWGGKTFYAFPRAETFLEEFDQFIYQHDEPPGSISQYASWCVMRLAREHGVPVLLNGQGGDELFSGYWPAYYLFLRQHATRSPLHVAKHLLGALLPGGNPMLVSQMLPHFRQYQHRSKRNNRALLRSHWSSAGFSLTRNWAQSAQQLEPAQYRLAEIRNVHLPRVLKWDDRNSMAFNIEARYPFLDYRLVEWAVSLPPEMNFRRGWNKLLLRHALCDILPPAVQWRRSKVGFETPQSVWIRTILRPTIRGVLTKSEAILLQNRASIGLVPYLPNTNTMVGMANKLLECMSLGLPLVFSHFPNYCELAGVCGAGLPVDPTQPRQIAEALECLVRNPELAKKMGEAGRRAVRERFNWASECTKLLSLYQEVLEVKSPRPKTVLFPARASFKSRVR
jgi:asparagine synthase (glutamine-hydrolysing)